MGIIEKIFQNTLAILRRKSLAKRMGITSNLIEQPLKNEIISSTWNSLTWLDTKSVIWFWVGGIFLSILCFIVEIIPGFVNCFDGKRLLVIQI